MGVAFQSYPQWALNSHLIPLPHLTVSGLHPQLADLPEPFFGSIVSVLSIGGRLWQPKLSGCRQPSLQVQPLHSVTPSSAMPTLQASIIPPVQAPGVQNTVFPAGGGGGRTLHKAADVPCTEISLSNEWGIRWAMRLDLCNNVEWDAGGRGGGGANNHG